MTGGWRQVRQALLLTLILGILGMHALVLLPTGSAAGVEHVAAPVAPPGAAMPGPWAGTSHKMAWPEDAATPPGMVVAAVEHPPDQLGQDAGHGSMPMSLHQVQHLCLAILVALLVLATIAFVLCWSLRPHRNAMPTGGIMRRLPRIRPPPTSVRLAQLCVLRN